MLQTEVQPLHAAAKARAGSGGPTGSNRQLSAHFQPYMLLMLLMLLRMP